MPEIAIEQLRALRLREPDAVADAAARRLRRPLVGESGRLMLIAADHPARGALSVRDDPMAMADRRELLRRLVAALGRPGVDGVLGTPDIVEDLLLLGALHGKVVFGSMNRGGLSGAGFELDDRFTAYDVPSIVERTRRRQDALPGRFRRSRLGRHAGILRAGRDRARPRPAGGDDRALHSRRVDGRFATT